MSTGPSIGGSIEPGRQISSCFKPIELGLELIPDAAGQSHEGNKKMKDNQQSLEWNLSLMQLAQKRYEEYRYDIAMIENFLILLRRYNLFTSNIIATMIILNLVGLNFHLSCLNSICIIYCHDFVLVSFIVYAQTCKILYIDPI